MNNKPLPAYHHVEADGHILYQGYDSEHARATLAHALSQCDYIHISYDVHKGIRHPQEKHEQTNICTKAQNNPVPPVHG